MPIGRKITERGPRSDSGGSYDSVTSSQALRTGKRAPKRSKREEMHDSSDEEDQQDSDDENGDDSILEEAEEDAEEGDSSGEEEGEEEEDGFDSNEETELTVVGSPQKPQKKRKSASEAGSSGYRNGRGSSKRPSIDAVTNGTAFSQLRVTTPSTPEKPAITIDRGTSTPPRPAMPPVTPRAQSIPVTPLSQSRSVAPPPALPVQPKIRLVIHKMVLRDFKSYAGEQIIGPFHKSFSAVVGPNGSGKSNVIDAMLFVFGWRANKMRQGKLSELIHNSAGHENIPQCSVEVWFREIVDLPGPDDFKVVPKSRLIVARTAYRNNSSVYTMNSKKSNFTEVTTLLKAKGIDLDHKRFLILQGEVESISQMPPKARNEHEEGLLEYLEDIIGTSCYKTPIEEAAKRVEEANDVRSERLSRLQIVKNERDSLLPRKREAEAYLLDQNNLTERQSKLWQVYMMECRDEMQIASTSMETLKTRLQSEREKNAGSKEEISTLETEFKERSQEYDGIVKEKDKVAKELSKYEKEDVQLQEKRKHLETKKKKLTKSMNEDKHATSEAKSTLSSSTQEIEMLTQEVAKLEASQEKEEAELERLRDNLKGKTEQFSQSIEKKQVELQPWIAKISEKCNARDVAVEEKRLLSERFEQVHKEAERAEAALQELKDSSEAKQGELERLSTDKSQQVSKVAQYEGEIQDMQKQEQDLRRKVQASQAKCEDAKASMQSNRSRGEVLNSLSRQADLGIIKGFFGRLGSLGVIDDKYDVAISTACPGLDNIVVEGVEHGQACIEYLRKNNLGRANFILLNSLGKMNVSPIRTPEDVPRLFDLVKPRDERFANAFYHQLRDTLVARDLTQANRIAYGAQRWRVVTLDGQLIDKSGTMSGGGNKVARGAMSSKASSQENVTLEQLSRMDKERQMNEDALRNHIKYTDQMRSMLDASRKSVPGIEMAMDKIRMDQQNSVRMLQEAQDRIKNIRRKSMGTKDDDDVKRVADLGKHIAQLDGEIAKLQKTSKTIEGDIAALQEKILEVGGVELRAQKSKVDGIKERSDLFGERMTKAEVAKAKAEKDLIKLDKSTQKNGEAIQEMEAELEGVLAMIADKAEAVETIRKQVEEALEEMEEKKQVKDEIKERLDKLLEGANAFRSLEVEIEQKLEDGEKSFTDNKKRLKHWQEKYSKLELHDIDGDEDEDAGPSKAVAKSKPVEQEAGEAIAEEDGDEELKDADVAADDDDNADEDVSTVIKDIQDLEEYTPDELKSFSKEALKAEIARFEEKLQKGQGNLAVLQEYKKRDADYLSRALDLEQTTMERDVAKKSQDELRKQRLDSFMTGFAIISSKLKEMYQTITLGGNAELELVDSLDPFSEGILFSVMPPKKSWKNISNLSGGEKTLSSLALVFALHAFKPTPLYAMDELDAALDFRNVSIVANLIKERTKGAQFIVISLRNNMFELASRLVGIYKTNGQTKSLAVHNSDLHAVAPPPVAAVPPTPSMARSSMQPPGSAVPSSMRQMNPQQTPHLPPPSSSVKPRPVHGQQRPLPSSMTTPSLHQLSIRKLNSSTSTFLGTPGHHQQGFSQIPATPRMGHIKGLGISASSMKLSSAITQQNLLRGGSTGGDKLSNSQTMVDLSGASTPLAVRRAN